MAPFVAVARLAVVTNVQRREDLAILDRRTPIRDDWIDVFFLESRIAVDVASFTQAGRSHSSPLGQNNIKHGCRK